YAILLTPAPFPRRGGACEPGRRQPRSPRAAGIPPVCRPLAFSRPFRIPPACAHLLCRSARSKRARAAGAAARTPSPHSAADGGHGPVRLDEAGFADACGRLLASHGNPPALGDLLVGGAGAQGAAQV